jgi:haloacetate dehalogenase
MPDLADLYPGYASRTTGLPAAAGIDALAAWRDWATDVRGLAIDSGHYVPEENPDATAKALLKFFAAR